MKEYEKVCIVCPVGCRLTITEDSNSNNGYRVEGNNCPRGEKYGIKEVTNPTRVLTTTVKISGAHHDRIPVISSDGLPKKKLFECMEIINDVNIVAPIKAGDVIVEDILDTGVDIVASRSMDKQ
ncbi:DUF1667 domain-containing protein [Clostridium sp. D2Q-14]|uniref:DUF1667 domain-containing protein n=1 Tax=Anaeromonas gelatinilytica TaxID=2683194 RepID=UPI00193B5D27|nr:DUF1667 domain-containing protein [Anaeromonas gelatinilytica]MBS4535104.1 DUF1667 domain-containing protein [Anaeromonas gelatinilytica]